MARGLVWSPEAIEDIQSIASYIERDSAWYAKAVASKVVEIAESIPRFPELGRIVPEIGDPAIRERFVYSYRVIYRLEPERILVAADGPPALREVPGPLCRPAAKHDVSTQQPERTPVALGVDRYA